MNRDIAKVLISSEEISDIVSRMAEEISRDYSGEDKKRVLLCILKGCFRNPASTQIGSNLKITAKILGDLNSATSKNVLALCVFTEEGPINALFGDCHRSYVSKEVKFASHSNVCAFKFFRTGTTLGSCCGTFEQNVAFFNI